MMFYFVMVWDGALGEWEREHVDAPVITGRVNVHRCKSYHHHRQHRNWVPAGVHQCLQGIGFTFLGTEEPQLSLWDVTAITSCLPLAPPDPGSIFSWPLPWRLLCVDHRALLCPPPSGWGAPRRARGREETEDGVFILLAPFLQGLY